jgi:hypothetical protein
MNLPICNINELTDLNRYDPISGFPVYKALLCEITRVVKGEGTVEIDSGEYVFKDESIGAEKSRQEIRRIYLDHNATTPLADEVIEVISEAMKSGFGNPSSIYKEGRSARIAIESARRQVARLINCKARRVVFTGGGSEANNIVIKGVAFADWNSKKHIITSSIEHPSVLATCRWLERKGFDVTYLRVDSHGRGKPLWSALWQPTMKPGLSSL